MNIRVKSTGKVHIADKGRCFYWLKCSEQHISDAEETADYVTCKHCLRILGKKK